MAGSKEIGAEKYEKGAGRAGGQDALAGSPGCRGKVYGTCGAHARGGVHIRHRDAQSIPPDQFIGRTVTARAVP